MGTNPDVGELERERDDFQRLVRGSFTFVELAGMSFQGVRRIGGDPRDSTLIARYVGPDWRFDVGWNRFELSLSVLVKFDRPKWHRHHCYVYFEPFIEYLTEGQDKAIVPYVTESMDIRSMKSAMLQRRDCFSNGLEPVLSAIGKKMEKYASIIGAASEEQVLGYHKWIGSSGKSVSRPTVQSPIR